MLIIKNSAAPTFLSLLFLTVVLAGCTPRGPRALLDGKKLLDQGHYTEATEKLRVATELMNTNAVAWNYLGLALHHSGLSTNAEEAYLKALALDRNLVEANFNLGSLRLETGQFELAKNALMAYTALRGNAPEGWVQLGTAEYHLEEIAAAERSFIEALNLDNKNSEAWNGLGLIQIQRRDFRQAGQYFTNALIVQADFAPALLNLAILNQSYLNNRPLALQKYREYLALPNRPE
ncbi:MAG TPA: tetratricopeptide repeat protein, partial [Verrucomicrobiae bacterium]